jgi:DNA-nicking Smr family endonuclease
VKRPLRPEELQLWAKVAATVRPSAGRKPPKPPPDPAVASEPVIATTAVKSPPKFPGKPTKPGPPSPPTGQIARPPPKAPAPPGPIEPRRKRRIVREQELGPTLDLHGLDQDRARAALSAFLRRSSEDGWRAVLVITGKGSLGDGILRRMTPEWLADPSLRDIVAGVSEAHRGHGGWGALYVALKRRVRP